MARAKINLTCHDCGRKFEHIKFCNNRSDADSYEAWAVENVTQCPTCYQAALLAQKLKGLDLPAITGKSDKQIAYAKKLRDKAAADSYIKTLIPGATSYMEKCRAQVANDPNVAAMLAEKAPGLTGDDAILAVWQPSMRRAYLLATCGDAHTLIESLNK